MSLNIGPYDSTPQREIKSSEITCGIVERILYRSQVEKYALARPYRTMHLIITSLIVVAGHRIFVWTFKGFVAVCANSR